MRRSLVGLALGLALLQFSADTFAQSVGFQQALENYLLASEAGATGLARARVIGPVKDVLFAEPFSPTYVQNLRHLDALQRAHPRAILELSIELQLHWEARFGAALAMEHTRRLDQRQADQKIGYALGLAGLSLSVLTQGRVPLYFLLFRGFLPYAGLQLYRSEGSAAVTLAPPAPAHVLRLGIPVAAESIAERLSRDQSTRGLEIWAASLSLGAVASDLAQLLWVARGVSAASGFLRIHPLAFAVGFVVSTAANESLEYAIERQETARHEANFLTAARNLQTAARSGREDEVYARAQRLALRASELAAFRNQALWSAAPRAAQMARDGQQEQALATLTQAAEEAASAHFGTDHTEEKAYLVRSLLRVGVRSQDLAEQEELAALALAYERRFDRLMRISRQDRVQAWQDFLHAADRSESRALSEGLIAGRVAQHPSVVLWQAIALIRSLGFSFLDATADALEARIQLIPALLGSAQGGQP
jgi:hypothetical protein